MSSKSSFCASCGVFGPTHRHHMVPQVMGGADLPTVELCVPCHGSVHGRVWSVDHHELTRIGLAAAKAKGRIGGNPGLRARDPEMVRKIRASRDAAYKSSLLDGLDAWLPTVEKMRPNHAWGQIVLVLNRDGGVWTTERLRRSVHRLVKDGSADPAVLGRSPRSDTNNRVVEAVALMATSHPGATLTQLADKLMSAGYRGPRGGDVWYPAAVRHFLIRAETLGLVDMDAFALREPLTYMPVSGTLKSKMATTIAKRGNAVLAKPATGHRRGYGPRRLTKGSATAHPPIATPPPDCPAATGARRQSPQLQFSF